MENLAEEKYKDSLMETFAYSFEVIDAVALNEILSIIPKNDKAVIYGVEECGCKCFMQLLSRGVEVEFFVDRNDYRQREQPFFLPVLSLEEFKESYHGQLVFIGTYRANIAEEICDQIAGFVPRDKMVVLPVKTVKKTLIFPEYYAHGSRPLTAEKSMQGEPKITVITICYNTPEHYLRRTIESVLNQSLRDFTYLIVDHGSNDGTTAKIIREYAAADPHIEVVQTERNYFNDVRAGLEKDRTKLWEVIRDHLHTKYACMLDSDDYIERSYLETALAALRAYDADTYFIGSISYDEDAFAQGHLWPSFRLPPADRVADTNAEKAFLYANAIGSVGGWAMLTRSELLLRGLASVWIRDDAGSDLIAGFQIMRESKRSVYGGEICLCYVNRTASVSGEVLKKDVLFRLKNIIDMCLLDRPKVLRDMMDGALYDIDQALYSYTEYNLMVLFQYLDEVCRVGCDQAGVEEIRRRLTELKKEEYLYHVLCSRVWHFEQYVRFCKEFGLEGDGL